MKRPAFMFYPADWIKDLGLKACSIGARGLWIEMLCLAHESERYGYLVINGKPMSDAQIAASTRAPVKALTELERAGVFSRDDSGTVYCRRMVRDERVRNTRADGGKLGGNPTLLHGKDNHKDNSKDNRKVEGKVNHQPNLMPTPSFALAVALSDSIKPGVDVTQPSPPQTNGTDSRHPDAETSQPEGQQRTTIRQQWRDPAWVAATARIVQVERRTGESDTDFADRVSAALDAKRRTDKAESERRAR